MRDFILNADDYGMDDAVDDAILALAEKGVVTATSVMVLAPDCPAAARRLADVPIDTGLHLDFTSGYGNARFRLGALIASAWTGRLDEAALRAEIAGQLDRFEDQLGGPPDFVDGHQHVHQLPQIRTQLFSELRQRYKERLPRLRSCLPARWRGTKAWIVAATGAHGLGRLAGEDFSLNSDFAGVYDFSPEATLPQLWQQWLQGLRGESPLLMAHVAQPGPECPDDVIRGARLKEFAWLGSAEFSDLLSRLGRRPARWSSLSS